ncbi:unnamed protein product, partial [Medioppia subpectinata]
MITNGFIGLTCYTYEIGCGVGRKGNLMDNTCFPFHTAMDTVFAGIQNGRVVQPGETPWTVYIIISKTSGCANCTVTDIRVYAGLIDQSITNLKYYTGGKYYINPDYAANKWFAYDLALIRLDTSIPLDGTSGRTGINAICLPEENVTNIAEEYALLNGFGHNTDDGWGKGVQRVGWTKIMKSNPNNSHGESVKLFFKRTPYPTGTAGCTTNGFISLYYNNRTYNTYEILYIDGYNGNHMKIHFYDNITHSGCGVGKKANLMDSKCFTYHTSSDTMFDNIQNGRVVQPGETPWT